MLAKFKRIKDRPYFYEVLSIETGKERSNIEKNWFKKLFVDVPKLYVGATEEVIEKTLLYQNELAEETKRIKNKYFGN